MLSMPPATMISWVPASSMSCANIAAFMPEPHIFDSVTAPTLLGRPALNSAWRAGAWPWPAIRQLPNSTSPTESAGERAPSAAGLLPPAPPAGGVLAAQQLRQVAMEVLAPAPLAHEVVPAVPAPALVLAHVRLVRHQVGALEQRDQHVEDDQHAFALLRARVL